MPILWFLPVDGFAFMELPAPCAAAVYGIGSTNIGITNMITSAGLVCNRPGDNKYLIKLLSKI
jgi:hypothetical protein